LLKLAPAAYGAHLHVFLLPSPPVATVTAVWPTDGPLGVNFAPDLTVLATSPATQRSHPQLTPGLRLSAVQGGSAAGMSYAAAIELLRSATRPLTLVFLAREDAEPSVATPAPSTPERVEVTDGDLGIDGKTGKEFVGFTVACHGGKGEETWRLQKRFSEFCTLRDILLRGAAEAAKTASPSVASKTTTHMNAPATPERPVALYVCMLKTIVRASCEMESEAVGMLQPGDEVEALEIRHVGECTIRIRCSLRGSDLPGGWCTAQNQNGVVIREFPLLSIAVP
jgi:hypothetical protein